MLLESFIQRSIANLERNERYYSAVPTTRWILFGMFAVVGTFMMVTGYRDGFTLGTLSGAAFIIIAIAVFIQQRRLYGTRAK